MLLWLIPLCAGTAMVDMAEFLHAAWRAGLGGAGRALSVVNTDNMPQV